ncbi:hypothetical protein AOLI_G00201970 [Acnodon oligacanthus]
MSSEEATAPAKAASDDDGMSWWYRWICKIAAVLGGISCAGDGGLELCDGAPLKYRCRSLDGVDGVCAVYLRGAVLLSVRGVCERGGGPGGPHAALAESAALLRVRWPSSPVFLSLTLTTLFGNAIAFATGVLYGLASLGKKGDAVSYARLQHQKQADEEKLAGTTDGAAP